MRGCLGLFVFLFLFLPIAFATLLMLSVSSWVFDRGFYAQALDNPALYEALLSEEIPITLTANTPGQPQDLDAAYYRALGLGLREVVTVDYLRTQVTSAVDQFFNVFEGQDTQIVIDLTPVKAALRGEKAEAFARVMADNLPECAGTQQRINEATALPLCVPSTIARADMAAQITQAIPGFLEVTPNQLDLINDIRAENWQGATTLKQVVNAGLIVLLVMAVGLWLVVGFAGGTNVREVLLWLGGSLFIPASLVLLLGLALGAGAVSGVVRDSVTNATYSGISGTQEFRTALADISVNTVGRVANGFITTGAIASVFAAAVFVLGLLTPVRKRKEKVAY